MDQPTQKNFTSDYFHNSYFNKAILLVVVFLAIFLAVKSVGVVKGFKYIGSGVPVTNIITVAGEGEVFAIPDIATFTFSVVEERESVKEAQTVITRKANDMIAYLKREGVDEKDIKTLAYRVSPRYEYENFTKIGTFPVQNRKRVLVGFEVRQNIFVKVRDIQKAGSLLSGIGGRGVSNISSLQFTVDNEKGLKMEARRKAIKDAKNKAKLLAEDLGVTLVRTISFSESKDGYYTQYGPKESIMDGVRSFKDSPQIPVGRNKILSNISITYEIR